MRVGHSVTRSQTSQGLQQASSASSMSDFLKSNRKGKMVTEASSKAHDEQFSSFAKISNNTAPQKATAGLDIKKSFAGDEVSQIIFREFSGEMATVVGAQDLQQLLTSTPLCQRLCFSLAHRITYSKPTGKMAEFFYRNLVSGNEKFENLSVISTGSNVELVTATFEK